MVSKYSKHLPSTIEALLDIQDEAGFISSGVPADAAKELLAACNTYRKELHEGIPWPFVKDKTDHTITRHSIGSRGKERMPAHRSCGQRHIQYIFDQHNNNIIIITIYIATTNDKEPSKGSSGYINRRRYKRMSILWGRSKGCRQGT